MTRMRRIDHQPGGDINCLRLIEDTIPTPGPGEVLIKVPPERAVMTPTWELLEHVKGLWSVFVVGFAIRATPTPPRTHRTCMSTVGMRRASL